MRQLDPICPRCSGMVSYTPLDEIGIGCGKDQREMRTECVECGLDVIVRIQRVITYDVRYATTDLRVTEAELHNMRQRRDRADRELWSKVVGGVKDE